MKEKAVSQLKVLCMMLVLALSFPLCAHATELDENQSHSVPAGLYELNNNMTPPFLQKDFSTIKNTMQEYSIAPVFLDDYLIWHHESVDVIATLRIVSGSSNNVSESEIHPLDGLTRQAAAKMIYLMCTGGLGATEPPEPSFSFLDVSADNQFAGYISWCLENNIVSGYQDGIFKPTDGLTRDAYLKMLLCSLGYNQQSEGYLGQGWRNNVEKRAEEAGLMSQMPQDGTGTDKVLRSEAMLMTFNALKADMVQYNNSGAIQKVTGSGQDANRIKQDSILQFGEVHFSKLEQKKKYIGSKEGVEWRYEKDLIGVYFLDGNRSGESETETYILLNGNGGNVLPQRLPVNPGSIYEVLPIPTLNGYSFEGWYDNPDNNKGNRIMSVSVEANKQYEYYAHWKPMRVVVHLEPNTTTSFGTHITGTVEPNDIEVEYAGIYGNLPGPRLDPKIEYNSIQFMGWYDRASGGTRIDSQSTVKSYTDHTLYAHWVETEFDPDEPGRSIGDITYRFENNTQGLQNASREPIGLGSYKIMFGNNLRTKQIFNRVKYNEKFVWNGSCYGMVATSGLFSQEGSGVDVKSFKQGANHPVDLALDDVYSDVWMPDPQVLQDESGKSFEFTLKEFINAMHVSQYSRETVARMNETSNRFDDIISAVRNGTLSENEGLVIVCIFGSKEGIGNSRRVGHAVLGYSVDDMADGSVHLYVYDPNKPLDGSCFINFTPDESGNITQWEYKLNNETTWGTNDTNALMQYVPYETYKQSWENRGTLESNMAGGTSSLMTINVDNATLYKEDGKLIASFRNGVRVDGDVHDDILQILPLGGSNSVSQDEEGSLCGIALYLPASNMVKVKNETPEYPLNVSLTDVNLGIEAETQAETITLLANDATQKVESRITESESNYDITIYDDHYCDESFLGEIRIQGITGENGIYFSDSFGTIRVSDISGISSLTCNGRAIPLTGTLEEGEYTLMSPCIWREVRTQ